MSTSSVFQSVGYLWTNDRLELAGGPKKTAIQWVEISIVALTTLEIESK